MTINQRGSAVNVALPFGRVMPVPDGSLANEEDRKQMAMSYVLSGTPVVVVRQLAALGVG